MENFTKDAAYNFSLERTGVCQVEIIIMLTTTRTIIVTS